MGPPMNAIAWFRAALGSRNDRWSLPLPELKPLGSCAFRENSLSTTTTLRSKKVTSRVEAEAVCSVASALSNNLGLVLMTLGKLEEAIPWFEKAIELHPTVRRNNLGLALMRLSELEQAILSFEKAIELDPSNAPAHTNLKHARALVAFGT